MLVNPIHCHRYFRLPMLMAAAAVALAALPANAEDANAICRGIENSYISALETGDPAKLAAVYTEDGLLNGPEGIFQGSKALTPCQRPTSSRASS